MLKRLITYTDFDDTERTEEFYFNLSKGELTKMELMGEDNSLSATLTRISENQKGKELIPEFERIVSASYGVRAEDGKSFDKSSEVVKKFVYSAAYDQLIFELLTDAEKAATFINNVLPSNLMAQANASNNAGKTPSQIAREASEAQMQGRRPKTSVEPVETTRVPNLPAAPPQLEEPKKEDGVPLTEAEIDALPVSDDVKAAIRAAQNK